ncbi:MAG TPA: aromatic-ring-hydroxylating dioxygenase subunit beta [Xanthobacteraceae bacterium]|nr:aromatic-ring-hydroxylating dioxygenase subunit beta [Xanthobacteraceae bacterium]
MDIELLLKVQTFLARYAQIIDDDLLEEWPALFVEAGRYVVTTDENFRRGFPIGMMYATSRAMLWDRIKSLRDANVYEAQRYRHILGAPLISPSDGGVLRVQSNFLVARIMHTGETTIFATGRYEDRIVVEGEALAFAERIVVLDSRQIDTLLAIPL